MNWEPFEVLPRGKKTDRSRPITTVEGIGDRLRSAAFAEIQAREAFLWAASSLKDAQPELRQAWMHLSQEEDKHLHWLLKRMQELCIPIKEKKVSNQLWISLVQCKSAREFTYFMASSEERGQKAGFQFYKALLMQDPVSAKIFHQISIEEIEHIALTHRFFPTPCQSPLQHSQNLL